jgi:hypothetical protein
MGESPTEHAALDAPTVGPNCDGPSVYGSRGRSGMRALTGTGEGIVSGEAAEEPYRVAHESESYRGV